MKKIKKIKRRVAALAISFFLTLGLTAPAFNFTVKAEALEVANATCTVADMIFSYCASGGVAVMNETIIDEVYNVLGSSFGTLQTFVDNGLLTYSNGQYVDTGLSTNISGAIENISSIDIGALFAQTAEQNPAGVALTGGGSLAGIAGSVATTGVLPIAAGVAVSGYCGFQIGTIIANMLGLYGKTIASGVPITNKNIVTDVIPDGGTMIINNSGTTCYISNGIIKNVLQKRSTDDRYTDMIYIFGNPGTYNIKQIRMSDGFVNVNNNVTITDRLYKLYNTLYPEPLNSVYHYMPNHVTLTANETSEYINGFNSLDDVRPKSPDIIGEDGNVGSSYSESEGYSFPDVAPQVNPDSQSINPSNLNKDDWLGYASTANSNYIDGNPQLNSQVLADLIEILRLNIPTPSPEPEPDPNPNPDPETVPLPDINPYPDTYPVADPETVPDNKPQPEYTEKATENESDIIEGDPYTTPDLLNKFPFCIPRDILKVFKKLDSGARQAPHIQWRFNPNNMIDYTFEIDFSTWDSIASLLRILELLAFIIALGLATRNLILS